MSEDHEWCDANLKTFRDKVASLEVQLAAARVLIERIRKGERGQFIRELMAEALRDGVELKYMTPTGSVSGEQALLLVKRDAWNEAVEACAQACVDTVREWGDKYGKLGNSVEQVTAFTMKPAIERILKLKREAP